MPISGYCGSIAAGFALPGQGEPWFDGTFWSDGTGWTDG
jgi:hypothetical protein